MTPFLRRHFMMTIRGIPLALLAASVLAETAAAQVETLNPSADAFVSANPAQNALGTGAIRNSNYGGAGALGIAAAVRSQGEFDALMMFNLSTAKTHLDAAFGTGRWMIQSVKLRFTATAPMNAIFNGHGEGPTGNDVNFGGQFSLQWLQNDSWLEGSGRPVQPTTDGVTFANLNSLLSAGVEKLGTFTFGGATTGDDTWTLNLTPAFLADVSAGGLVSLVGRPEDDTVAYLFNSKTGGGAPLLTITAVAAPEPSATVLLAGAGLLGAARRWRHARGE